MSGSSAPRYGIALLQTLHALGSVETHLVLSRGARRTIQLEADLDPELVCRLADVRGGVPTVWIVNVPDQQVEEYRADRPSHRVYLHDDPLEVDGATVDLAALFEDLDDEAG